jgi:hypothetical protein
MHPDISRFPASYFYAGRLSDGRMVRDPGYGAQYARDEYG